MHFPAGRSGWRLLTPSIRVACLPLARVSIALVLFGFAVLVTVSGNTVVVFSQFFPRVPKGTTRAPVHEMVAAFAQWSAAVNGHAGSRVARAVVLLLSAAVKPGVLAVLACRAVPSVVCSMPLPLTDVTDTAASTGVTVAAVGVERLPRYRRWNVIIVADFVTTVVVDAGQVILESSSSPSPLTRVVTGRQRRDFSSVRLRRRL